MSNIIAARKHQDVKFAFDDEFLQYLPPLIERPFRRLVRCLLSMLRDRPATEGPDPPWHSHPRRDIAAPNVRREPVT